MKRDVPKNFDFKEIKDWYLGIAIKKFADFNGRARRKEFWYFFLANVVINTALWILSAVPILGWLFIIVAWVFSLAVIIPNLAIGVRRLHDTNRTGLWLLLALIPLVGAIILIIWAATEGTHGSNQYGPDPKGRRK